MRIYSKIERYFPYKNTYPHSDWLEIVQAQRGAAESEEAEEAA